MKKKLTSKEAYELNQKLALQMEKYQKELFEMIEDNRTCKPKIQQRMKEFNNAFSMLVCEIYKNTES